MDTKSLKIFQHLARSLHFTKTADKFHMSPSTLSRLVQRMEQRTQCQLLDRDNRSVELTSEGKKLLEFADQQLQEWQLFKDSISLQKEHLTGKLHLFCSVTAAYSHLPTLLDQFRLKHPKVEILLTTGDPADAIAMVHKQSVDIAIAAKPARIVEKLKFTKISDIPLSIIAPQTNLTLNNRLKDQKIDWPSIPFILPNHGPARARFDRWLASKTTRKPNIYATVSGHEALVSMVALGCGVGIAPQVVVENSPVKDRVKYLNGLGSIEPFSLGICCLQKRKDSPIIKAFFNLSKGI